MLEINKIYQGSCLNWLKNIDNESIDCVITSPPYWALRIYQTEPEIWDGDKNCEHKWGSKKITLIHKSGEKNPGKESWYKDKGASDDKGNQFCSKCNAWKGSLGLEPTFDLYIKHLCDIFDEVKRVLKKEGTCWIVIGDTYFGGGGKAVEQSSKRQSAINTGAYPDYPPNSKLRSQMGKSLCLIPFRFAIEMTNRGWILRNTIIWEKPNCMPSSAKDRFTVDFEYVFFFTKSKKYYFEQQLEKSIWADKDYRSKIKGGVKSGGKTASGNYATNKVAYTENGMKNKRAVWTISTKPFKENHFAVFPEELIETPVKAGCPKNGIILDPFMGSGTTGLVAKKLGRNFIGIELNPNYVEIANRRISELPQQLF